MIISYYNKWVIVIIRSEFILIFINSKNRDDMDTPCDTTIEVPTGLIQITDPTKERIKVALMSFTGWFSWSEINNTNNTFAFKNLITNQTTSISLNNGNYPLQKLARIINTLYSEVQCHYIVESNKFVFTFNQPHSITFTGRSFDVLGFEAGDDGIQGTTITSIIPIKPMKRLNMYVRLMDAVPCDDCMNLDNFNSIHLQPSNVLCSFPINASPFMSINFNDANVGEIFGMWIGNTQLTKLHFQLTDCEGNVLDMIDDYEIQFQIGIYSLETDIELKGIKQELTTIKTTLQNIAMMNFLDKKGMN